MMITQHIQPERNIFFAGETVRFTLQGIPPGKSGRAILRTNIGFAAYRRRELIERTENNRPPRNTDWHDVPMKPEADNSFSVVLPLAEVGLFEAKCCFLAEDAPALWPQGENFKIKVEPAKNISGNSIYCAFVRQFNKFMHLPHSPSLPDLSHYDNEGFVIVPPSGTFRQVIAKLDHIFGTLNCRILQLLPIHPVPMAYGRMGRYGSPFAATDYFAVDPALADFDKTATPMEQFMELIDAVHCRKGRIFMDIPVNHTGWASKIQCEHPDYFMRRDDRSFESPGAWGIVWADLCSLDYRKLPVHELMAKVFLFWCRRGVDGFRCDAGYMVPSKAWDYIVSAVRVEYPETVFLLEGLGGPLAVQENLLSQSGLDWGYSELFQNYNRDEISRYYPYMNDTGNRIGTLVNFAETHDNDRLGAKGRVFARNRFLVTALLSQHGAFGFANGAEFFAAEKIDVHGNGALNFGHPDNLNTLIGKLNTLLSTHPAFGVGVDVKLIQRGGGNCIAALRRGKNIPELLILLNLDCNQPTLISFPETGHTGGIDLLTGEHITFKRTGELQQLAVPPGGGRCISFDGFTLPTGSGGNALSASICRQSAFEMAQKAAVKLTDLTAAAEADGEKLLDDPEEFVAQLVKHYPPPVTVFRYPEDCHKTVMIPPGDLLLVKSSCAFAFDLVDGKRTIRHCTSLPYRSGDGEFALVTLPDNESPYARNLTMHLTLFSEPDKAGKKSAALMQLPEGEKRRIRLSGKWDDASGHTVFGSNCFGGYSLFNTAWGRLTSKYEAILAANINRNFPVDRHVMFTACRAWLVVDEYSQELTAATLESYTAGPGNRASFNFLLPDGHGGSTRLKVGFVMAQDKDQVFLTFSRCKSSSRSTAPARLILRPDLEDRINHAVTRACDGPENLFRRSVNILPNGFDFQPAGRKLSLRISDGGFFHAPEWRYMVDLPAERYYGLPDKTDLFSPGYFAVDLAPGETVTLGAAAIAAGEKINEKEFILPMDLPELPPALSPAELAVDALRRFVVKRDGLASIIAGYPWFLDWGRDTLITLRGLLKFPEFQQDCALILRRFAAFEKDGTIPNMICGGNDSNRDTSDAPLYFIVAVRDYIAESGDKNFPDSDCGGRTIRQVISSIITNFRHGTPNGIVMDPASKLLFSPSHFSWMDTNHPAGTPREGYPIEIQSLWYAALKFNGETGLASEVAASIARYFFIDGGISDCLHCKSGTPASAAIADDHIRCNMLTAITLGAVTDKTLCRRILNAASGLLIPGAIRTLDDKNTSYPLPVIHHGNLLNDPYHPYRGEYKGPEDTERKAAYHNGTAWCWPFPAYCEALYMTGGEKSRKRALALLMSCAEHFESGVIGELPEVLDGNSPHRPGGCPAQAWSVSEFYRVFTILNRDKL